MDLAEFTTLHGPAGAALLSALPPYDAAGAITVADHMRRQYPPGLVAAALTQQRLRIRARAKFGADAARMWFTPTGLEQATRGCVARHHAARYAAAGAERVMDLCCGIGADLVAIARIGVRVTGVDRDPLTLAVAAANAAALGVADRVETICADVTEVDLNGVAAVFLDPGRRTVTGRRTFDPGSYSPPYPFVADLAARVPATGAKLAPGIPHDVLPGAAEAEWVSVDGDVVEAALWFGPLASGSRRRATLLPSGASLVRAAAAAEPTVGPVGRWLHEPDGAVIRAGLVAEAATGVGGRLVDPTIAYVTADDLRRSAFTSAYEVLDVLPFAVKRLRSYLRTRAVGSLTVKKRGSPITPEQLRDQLRLSGPEHATVVLTRVAGAPTVLVVEPVPR